MSSDRYIARPRAASAWLAVLMLTHIGFWLAFGRLSSVLLPVVGEYVGLQSSRFALEISIIAVPVIVLALPLSGLWMILDRHGLEPSTTAKFSLGLVLLAASYFYLGVGLEWGPGVGSIVVCVSLAALAALCLGPASLTVIGELGQREHRRGWVSVWLLGWLLARVLGGWTEALSGDALIVSCVAVGLGCVLAGVGLAFAWGPITRLAAAGEARTRESREHPIVPVPA